MSYAAICTPSAVLDGIWADLAHRGYALTDDQSIGLPDNFRKNFSHSYFNTFTLRHDNGDWPVDRQRARDVIRYQWGEGRLRLDEHETITISDRAGITGKRDHSWVRLLGDPLAGESIGAFLQLVPPGRRQSEGTFGVNLLRTFTNVVTAPHHDDEEFIIVYVLSRIGGGAVTYLYGADDVAEDGRPTASPILRQQLNPGGIIIFEDKLFKHGATPLEDPPGGTAMRDALVCTVDYRSTYLDPSAVA